jgi:hypothetical protein
MLGIWDTGNWGYGIVGIWGYGDSNAGILGDGMGDPASCRWRDLFIFHNLIVKEMVSQNW